LSGTDAKGKFDFRKEMLNKSLPLYEKNRINNEFELDVMQYFYILNRGSNKQTIKFRNKDIISLLNYNIIKIQQDEVWKNFYTTSLISKEHDPVLL
jgi:hypothetical protein